MSNDWSAFESITDKTGIKFATVVAHSGTESVVRDLNNRQFRVPGTDYEIDSNVYIQNGSIISQATTLMPGGTHYV